MKIKFIKEYCTCFRDEENMINTETFKPDDTVSTSMEVDRYFTEELARWLIDNGFAEEVKESGWWKPKGGEKYYFVDDAGYINSANWTNQPWEVDRYKMGNVFKTEEATERYCDYRKAIVTIRQDEGIVCLEEICERHDLDDGNYCVYTVGSDPDLKELVVLDSGDCITANSIWFGDEKHAQASLDKHPNGWKTILSYDWSRE